MEIVLNKEEGVLQQNPYSEFPPTWKKDLNFLESSHTKQIKVEQKASLSACQHLISLMHELFRFSKFLK